MKRVLRWAAYGLGGLVTVVLWVAAVFAHPTQDGAR